MIRHATPVDVVALAMLVVVLVILRELLATYPVRYVASGLLVWVCLALLAYIIVFDKTGVES